VKYKNIFGETVERKRSLTDFMIEELAKENTAQELCKQIVDKAKQGDITAFKIIKDIIAESGIID